MRHIARALMLVGLLAASTAARAVRLALLEEQFPDGPIITNIRIDDVLGESPSPHLKIFPEQNAEHRKLVTILSAGMPFEDLAIRGRIAQVLSGYPAACKATMGVSMVVGPIGDIDRFVPGVTDKRRILNLYVGNCLAVELPECEYDIDQTGEVDFGLGALIAVLRDCRDATLAAVKQGARYADAVYAARPELKKPTAVPPKP